MENFINKQKSHSGVFSQIRPKSCLRRFFEITTIFRFRPEKHQDLIEIDNYHQAINILATLPIYQCASAKPSGQIAVLPTAPIAN